MGGRPRGVLNPATIKKIQTKKAMEEEIQKRAGILVDDLFRASQSLKVEAAKELLDRGFGKVPQGVNIQAVQFSLKELSEYRKNLQQGDQQGLPELPKPEETK
jgi:phosphoribosylpyrophosphate synthetase